MLIAITMSRAVTVTAAIIPGYYAGRTTWEIIDQQHPLSYNLQCEEDARHVF